MIPGLAEWIREEPERLCPPRLPLATAAMVFGSAWIEEPVDRFSESAVWVRWLRLLGFVGLGAGLTSERAPVRPLRLYRGCAAGFERGMSWTSRRELAVVWACGVGDVVHERRHGLDGGRVDGHGVFVTTVRPAAVLAHIRLEVPLEGLGVLSSGLFDEWVVDPAGLGRVDRLDLSVADLVREAAAQVPR